MKFTCNQINKPSPKLIYHKLALEQGFSNFCKKHFSLPTWEGSKTHLQVATHSLRNSSIEVNLH